MAKASSPGKVCRVVLADDDPLVRSAVKAILESQPDFSVVAEANDGQQAMQMAVLEKPNILVLDLNMPNKPGLEALRGIGSSLPAMRTLVLTINAEKRQIMEAIQLGARGVVLKQHAGEALVPALHAIIDGEYWVDRTVHHSIHDVLRTVAPVGPPPTSKRDLLTPREMQIVRVVVEGATNKDIAAAIKTSAQVVKNNLGRIFDKLGVFNRLELALYALDNGLAERTS